MGSRRMDSGIEQDVSGAVTITGKGMDFSDLTGGSFHVVTTGTIAGSITLETSNDSADWVVVSIVQFEALAGAPSKQVVEVSSMRSAFYRLVAALTSGAGHISARVHAKGI